jgi:hypothetical protein
VGWCRPRVSILFNFHHSGQFRSMTTGSGLVYIINKAKYKYTVVCEAQRFFEMIYGISKRLTFSFTDKLKKKRSISYILTIPFIYIMTANGSYVHLNNGYRKLTSEMKITRAFPFNKLYQKRSRRTRLWHSDLSDAR